ADELDHAIAAAELMEDKYGEKASAKPKRKFRSRRKAVAKKKGSAKNGGRTERQELLRRNHLLRASFYERIADFRTAAALYDSYYETYQDHEKAPDALFNAGIYFQGLGETDTAIAKFDAYIDNFQNKDEADVYWRICELKETKADWKATATCFDDFKKKYKEASEAKVFESRYRYALALEKLNRKPDAMKEYEWLVRTYPKLEKKDQEMDGARLAGAHAAFELLEPEYKRYAAMKVTLKKKSLLGKLKGAEELACVGDACKQPGKFLGVLTYGNGDYGICALTRMGQVYRNVADSIRAAPIPRRLTFDQQEIYRAELDTVALGPEEKGIEAFESALQRAYELNIYNDCTLTAQSNLKELNPNQFPELQKRGYRGAESFLTAGLRTDLVVADAETSAPEPGAEPMTETSAEAETAAGASE
ncbi:MAG: tetratricopeptide repeat protein, partial [Myxococcota bacterium]